MAIKAIIFDFDGVILPDSQHAKDTAYLKLFPEKDTRVSVLLPELSRRYGGGRGDRRDIIKDLYLELEDRTPTPDELAILVQKFSDIITKEIDNMVPPPSTVLALKTLSEKYPLYLASATPQDEIARRMERLDLAQYFIRVFGRPTTKDDVVGDVLKSKGIAPKEVVLIGDAPGDLETAERTAVHFVAVENQWNSSQYDMGTVSVHALDLGEISPILEKLAKLA